MPVSVVRAHAYPVIFGGLADRGIPCLRLGHTFIRPPLSPVVCTHEYFCTACLQGAPTYYERCIHTCSAIFMTGQTHFPYRPFHRRLLPSPQYQLFLDRNPLSHNLSTVHSMRRVKGWHHVELCIVRSKILERRRGDIILRVPTTHLSSTPSRPYIRTIGGRGVGNWEGDQPNFGRGGSGFWTPRGGNKFRLSEGGKGGE